MKYGKRFDTPCRLCAITLGWASQEIGPAFIYELHVSPRLAFEARHVVIAPMMEYAVKNPLVPHINIVVDRDYGDDEWSLHNDGRSMGSEGC